MVKMVQMVKNIFSFGLFFLLKFMSFCTYFDQFYRNSKGISIQLWVFFVGSGSDLGGVCKVYDVSC